MLTAAQFDQLSIPITDLYEKYNQQVIMDIARRLAKMGKVTSTAAWQMQKLTESGMVYTQAIDSLSQLTGQAKAELRALFKEAGVKSMKFDDSIYKEAGMEPVPLNLSPAMLQTLAAGIDKIGGVFNNLTMTTALDASNKFQDAADLAYMQVANGTLGYDEAIRQAIKEVADRGLDVINFKGRSDQLDVAMRRAVLTGVSQTTGNLQLERIQEMGTDLVQVSAHIGARPEHEEWQGQIYSISGTHPDYEPFFETTGYGTIEGLGGINCRHSFYPFFEGISENAYSQETLDEYADKTVTYNDEQMSVYEGTQMQRGIEREIRATKREAMALGAANMDNREEIAKVNDLQAQMRDFIKQTGLDRQAVREGGRVPKVIVEPPPPPPPASVFDPQAPDKPPVVGEIRNGLMWDGGYWNNVVPSDLISPAKGTDVKPGEFGYKLMPAGMSARREWWDLMQEREAKGLAMSPADEEIGNVKTLEGDKDQKTFLAQNEKGDLVAGIAWHEEHLLIYVDHLGSIEKGYGSELMKMVMEDAMDNHKGIAGNATKEAEGFYRHLGFEVNPKTGHFEANAQELRKIYDLNWAGQWVPQSLAPESSSSLSSISSSQQSGNPSGSWGLTPAVPSTTERESTDGMVVVPSTEGRTKGAFDSERVTIKGNGDAILKFDTQYEDPSQGSWFGGQKGFAHNEVTAYQLDRALGLGIVPKTTAFIEADGSYKSLQRWVDNSIVGGKVDDLKHTLADRQEVGKMALLDMIQGNHDRHGGNWVYTKDGHIFAIDNGLAFMDRDPKNLTDPWDQLHSEFLSMKDKDGNYVYDQNDQRLTLDAEYKHKLESLIDSGEMDKVLRFLDQGDASQTQTNMQGAMSRAVGIIDNWDKLFIEP